MNNPTLYLVGGIFLILFFCVMVYFFTKTFRALHVVFLFFTFSMAMWFLVMAALSHKTRLHWRERVNKLKQDVAEAKAGREYLINALARQEIDQKYPSIQGASGVSDEETVLSYRRKLNRVMLDRGRVWRSCTVAGVNAGAVQVNTAPAGAAEPTPNQLEQNDIVYAFLEGDATPPVNIKVPTRFLGEFRATAVTPSSVTLQPVDNRLLFGSQTQLIQNSVGGAATWSLYEIMPIDSHQIYAVDPNDEVKLTGVEGQAVFGQMDENLINLLYNPDNFIGEFQQDLGLAQPQQQQAARMILDRVRLDVLRDGGQVYDGGAASNGAVDPPENVFTKVQFEQDYTVEVDSDAGQGALTSNYYDSQGRAVVDRLRRNELSFLEEGEKTTQVAFKQGDYAIFNVEKADELIAQNIVKPIETRYVRKLVDFTFEAHKILDRITRINQDRLRVQSEIDKTNAAEAQTKRQRDFRKDERDKLVADKAKFDKEQQQATAYAQQLQQKMSRLRGELSALYRSNSALASRLEQRSQKLSAEINARTQAAAAAAAGDSGE